MPFARAVNNWNIIGRRPKTSPTSIRINYKGVFLCNGHCHPASQPTVCIEGNHPTKFNPEHFCMKLLSEALLLAKHIMHTKIRKFIEELREKNKSTLLLLWLMLLVLLLRLMLLLLFVPFLYLCLLELFDMELSLL